MGVLWYEGYGFAICGASYLSCASESFFRAAQSKSSLEAPLPIRKLLARAFRNSSESLVIILSHTGFSISPCHLLSSRDHKLCSEIFQFESVSSVIGVE